MRGYIELACEDGQVRRYVRIVDLLNLLHEAGTCLSAGMPYNTLLNILEGCENWWEAAPGPEADAMVTYPAESPAPEDTWIRTDLAGRLIVRTLVLMTQDARMRKMSRAKLLRGIAALVLALEEQLSDRPNAEQSTKN